MERYTYVTTSGRYGHRAGADRSKTDEGPTDPLPPKRTGSWLWEMIGSAAADGLLFWFWRGQEVGPLSLTVGMAAVGTVPKKRGRPPKIRP